MFIAKSLYYSIFVTLRMMPILAITLFAAVLLFQVFKNHLIVVAIVGALVLLPTLMFIYLMAIRCGLTAMAATKAPRTRNYLPAMIRFARIPVAVTNMMITLIGIGGSFVFLRIAAPDALLAVQLSVSGSEELPLFDVIACIAALPMAILLFFAAALTFAIALTGANAGATAHWIGERRSNLDMIWGITSQWPRLLVFALLTLILPLIGVIFWLGGPMAPLAQITTLTPPALLAGAAFFLWALWANCASQALAFTITAAEVTAEKAEALAQIPGRNFSTEDIRALRLSRMDHSKSAAQILPGK